MAVRRCKKEDLRRIAKATGATMISSLANLEGEETFEASSLGFAEEVVQERISDDELILVKGTKIVSSSSIILRGANGESFLVILLDVCSSRSFFGLDRLPSGRDGTSSPRLTLRNQKDSREWECCTGRRSSRNGTQYLPRELCHDSRKLFLQRHHAVDSKNLTP